MTSQWKSRLLLALVFVVGFGLGATVNLPTLVAPSGGPEAGTVNLMLDYGDGEVASYSNIPTAAENVFQITEKIAKENNLAFESQTYQDLGALITKIGEKKNGEDGRYWQYWVNQQKPEVGAGAYVPQSGDFIEWKFLPFKSE